MFINRSANVHRRGFTLLELTIVLGVIGAILGAIWYGSSNVREAQKENDAVNQMQIVSQNISTLMQGHNFSGTCPSNQTSAMITAGAIPNTYVNVKTTTTADTPWSPGNFFAWQIDSPNCTAGHANQFRLSFYNIPSMQACTALLSGGTNCVAGQAGCPAYVTLTVAASTIATPDATLGWKAATWQDGTAVNSASIAKWCATENYTGGGNGVEFTYNLQQN